jgi:4-hydroxybenzoate polyprenyltransferase
VIAFLFNNRILLFALPALLTAFWEGTLHFHASPGYYAMASLFTISSYIYNLLTDTAEDAVNNPPEGRVFRPGVRWVRPLIALLNLGAFALAVASKSFLFMAYAAVVNLFGFLYGVRLQLPGRKAPFRIKATPWLKNAYAALYWSAILLITPYLYRGAPVDSAVGYPVLLTFLIMFSMELAWDVRDQRGDSQAGVETLALRLGEARSRRLLQALNLAIGALLGLGWIRGLLPRAYLPVALYPLAALLFWPWYFRTPNRQVASQLYLLLFAVPILGGLGLTHFAGAPS